MESQESAWVKVEKLISGGEGLAFHEGKAVFVSGALPGETVRVAWTERRSAFDRAEVLEIREASPVRVVPPCPLYASCGGCDLQHLEFRAQGEAKRAIVQEAFARLGKISIPLPEIVQGRPWGYRHRIQIHKDRFGVTGFKKKRSDELLPVASCPVAAAPLSELLASAGSILYAYPPGRYTAFSDGQSFFVENRDREASVEILGKRFYFSMNGFFQSQLELLEPLIEWALEGLKGQTALDLYGGVGLFGAFLADRFARVVVVEENASALEMARRNVPGPQHRFFGRSVEAWAQKEGRLAAWDAVVVDPPRGGLSASVTDFLKTCRPARVIYVSCNPDTLARDAQRLGAAGLRLSALRLFDFYPQTSHIEACAKFDLKGNGTE